MINLLKFNRHWDDGFYYPYPRKREIFNTLIKKKDQRQIVEILGLRRTGKTTLLFQLINHLKEKSISPKQLWYFTFDEAIYDLDELFTAFKKQTGVDFKKTKVFIFLDEIQKLPDFQSKIKIYYDLYPEIKFFISGSMSLFIRKKAQESLAGRTVQIILKPLSFREFLDFDQKQEMIKNPELYWQEIEIAFERYLHRQFIETIQMDDDSADEYLKSILKKVVFEDIPTLYSVENPSVLFAILNLIATYPGLYLHHETLASDLKISQPTFAKYLTILEEAFLIKILFNFTGNMITSQKKLKRAYLASPSFALSLNPQSDSGLIVENYYLSQNDVSFFWRDPYKHEVDFVAQKDNAPLPIEIKFKKEIRNIDLRNLKLFIRKFKPKEAWILTRNQEEQIISLSDVPVRLKSIYKDGLNQTTNQIE